MFNLGPLTTQDYQIVVSWSPRTVQFTATDMRISNRLTRPKYALVNTEAQGPHLVMSGVPLGLSSEHLQERRDVSVHSGQDTSVLRERV